MSLCNLHTDEGAAAFAFGTRPATDMVCVPGGIFRMGSDKHYPEEAPPTRVSVGEFWIDRTPVTNRQFNDFVRATGHVTFAEIPPEPKDYPGALPARLQRGQCGLWVNVWTAPWQEQPCAS